MRNLWWGAAALLALSGCAVEERSDEALGAERANPTPVVPHEHTDDAGRRTDVSGAEEPNDCRMPVDDSVSRLRDDTQASDPGDACAPEESRPGGVDDRQRAPDVNREPEKTPAPPLPPSTPPEKMPDPTPLGDPRPRL